MWQKCPICDGTGRTQNTNSTSSYSVCSTCNGSKLISRLTGLPPNYEMNKKEEAERQKEIDEIIKLLIKNNFKNKN